MIRPPVRVPRPLYEFVWRNRLKFCPSTRVSRKNGGPRLDLLAVDLSTFEDVKATNDRTLSPLSSYQGLSFLGLSTLCRVTWLTTFADARQVSDRHDMTEPIVVAAVEGGGTSFQVVVGELVDPTTHQVKILHRTKVDSSHDRPHETLEACAAFLRPHRPIHALGVATFGPVGLDPSSDAYGCILSSSPKAAWRNVNVLEPLQEACGNPRVRVETDVNAPAYAEYCDSTNNISSLAYITVGTGVGVGLVVNHQCVHGRMHPEGGHVPVQPLAGDAFGGYSWGGQAPFGGQNTVEGLASSVALTERWQARVGTKEGLSRDVLATLPDDDELWDHAANALANLCVTLVLVVSVEKIVLGGGLMQRSGLLAKIQQRTIDLMNGYVDLPVHDMASLISTSRHGADAGLQGAMVLAARAALDGDDQEEKKALKQAKQEAFGHGLWHGMIVGALGTALLVKYVLFSGQRRPGRYD